MFIGVLQSFDEGECRLPASLAQVMIDSFLYVPVRQISWDDRLSAHPAVRQRTRSRRRSK